jgi:pilus assembly protein FimV
LKTNMTKSFRASLLALSIAALPLATQAAGLGQINVYSGLGQPLRAEIQVSATPQELQSLSARIASAEAFRQANLAYGSAASAIRVSVDTRAARPVIRLSSDRPINDPFVDLLVELNWATGRLVREYTFLLDPVDLAAPRPLAAAVDTPAAAPIPRAAARPAAPVRTAPAPRVVPETYTVRRGDTMHRIASANTQPGATLDQMLVALLRANPQAFDGGNINRLRAGSVLSVPNADTVRSIDNAEARRELRAQAADFEAYRRGLATAAGSRAPAPPAQAEQESAGRIVPKIEEPTAATEAGDQLKVSRSDVGEDAGAEARLQALEEELSTRSKALEEANERLAQLERSIRDLQRLLELQSGTMGQLQAGAETLAPADPAAQSSAPAPVADGESATPAAPVEQRVTPVEATEPPPAPAPAPQAAPAPVAPPAPRPAPVEAPPQPSFIESLLADPAVLAGGGGILALLLAYAGLKSRQRRKEAEIQAADAALGASTMGGDSQGVFAGTGGQSVDTGATSIMHTDFSQSGLSSIDTDEGVDPVAEADVYMAYGRDVQAEEILQDALKADPGRASIYVKLLEIYAQRRNSRQFEATASELFARTGGQGRDWDKVAALGRKVDPENPLYATAQDRAAGSAKQASAGADTLTAAGVATGVAAGGLAAASAAAEPVAVAADALPAAVDSEAEAVRHELSSLDFTTSGQIEPSHSQMRDTWTLPGDLSRLTAEEPQAGESGGAAAEPSDEPLADELAIDAGVIDFDLDLGEEAPDPEPTVEPLQAQEHTFDLDFAGDAAPGSADEPADAGMVFDLDIGEAEAAHEPAAGAARADASLGDVAPAGDAGLVTALDDVGQMVTGLDFELPDLDLDAPQDRFDLNATVVSDSAAHFELGDAGTPDELAAPSPAPEGVREQSAVLDQSVVDLEKTSFDSSLLDFDFELDAPAAPNAPQSVASPGLDLTSIDLDLDFESADEQAVPEVDVAPFSVAETQFDDIPGLESSEPAAESPVSEDNEEAETKLELARAYEEMGDKEGALELLDEVVGEGSARQQAAARDMIARLG